MLTTNFKISGTFSNHFDIENWRHIQFKHHKNPEEEELKHNEKCSSAAGCYCFMLLDPFCNMRKASYLDASTMYEVPLNCLQQFRGPKKLRSCSRDLAASAGAEAIADLLLSTEIYTTSTRYRLARELYATGRQPMSEGSFCWVQPANGDLIDISNRHRVRNAAGPCIVVRKRDRTATICIVRLEPTEVIQC